MYSWYCYRILVIGLCWKECLMYIFVVVGEVDL